MCYTGEGRFDACAFRGEKEGRTRSGPVSYKKQQLAVVLRFGVTAAQPGS